LKCKNMEKILSCLILLVATVLLLPGSFAEETQVELVENVTEILPVEEESLFNATYTADVNTTTLTMAVNETVLVSLAENPTTGYMWNVTTSSGLEIVNGDGNGTYTMDAAPAGMVGVGGIHEWIVQAVEIGNQTFSGTYMRSFEPVTGEEDTYTLDITVE